MFSISLSTDFVLRVDIGALIDAGQEGRLPVLRLLDRVSAGAHGQEAWQVLVVGAQAIGEPRPHARSHLDRVAAVHQQQRRFVVGDIGVHRADHGHVVDVLGGVWQTAH